MIRCPLRNQRSHSSRSSDVGKLLSNPPIALKEVVRGKKLCLARFRAVEVAVDNVKDYLTGRRVWILSECIYRPPSDEVIRQSRKSLRQRRQPFRCGAAVIIRKGEEPAARPLDTLVARRGGSAVAGRDEADGKAILKLLHGATRR